MSPQAQAAAEDKAEDQALSSIVPGRGLLRYAGPGIGVAGGVVALISFLGSKPEQAFKLLAQFGPKWVFATVCIFFVWDLFRRGLKIANKGVSHLGTLAENVGSASIGMNEAATAMKVRSDKSDTITQEMQLNIGYLAQQVRDTRDEQRTQTSTLMGMSAAFMRIEQKLGITPEVETKP